MAIHDRFAVRRGGYAERSGFERAELVGESAGRLPHVPVLMLLDRRADVFLARRSQAEGWLVKPLDSLRLRKAITAPLAGGRYEDDAFRPVTVVPTPATAETPAG